MGISRFLMLILIVFILFSCSIQSTNTREEYFENKNYIIDKSHSKINYRAFLNNTTIPKDGEYIYKGKKITPFGDIFNDNSGIHLKVNPNDRLIILVFSIGKEDKNIEYSGKITVKTLKNSTEIKINKSDIKKVFKPSIYRILIFRNDKPVLNYVLDLIY